MTDITVRGKRGRCIHGRGWRRWQHWLTWSACLLRPSLHRSAGRRWHSPVPSHSLAGQSLCDPHGSPHSSWRNSQSTPWMTTTAADYKCTQIHTPDHDRPETHDLWLLTRNSIEISTNRRIDWQDGTDKNQFRSSNLINSFWYHWPSDCALTLLVGRQERHPASKKQSGGVLVWLSVWSELQTCIWPADATATHCLLLQ